MHSLATTAPLVCELTVDASGWSVIGPAPGAEPRRLPDPCARGELATLVGSLRYWAGQPVPLDRADPLGTEAFVEQLARQISRRLTETLLTDADRRVVCEALAPKGSGRLIVRARATAGWSSAADRALSLPWELLAPEEVGSFPVQDGRLLIIRDADAPDAPPLSVASGPLTLAVSVAAPRDRAIFAEEEAFRLHAALSPLGQRVAFADLGSLEDLIELVGEVRATAIHFRGHGLPGRLVFENELGYGKEVPIDEVRRQLNTVLLAPHRAGAFPGLFFLAAPFSAQVTSTGEIQNSSDLAAELSAAASLHRSGFAHVVGYFGPVDPALSALLEERFYGTLAEGGTVLTAAQRARAALAEPVDKEGERVRYPFGWSQLALYHRGPDRPLAAAGRSDRRSRVVRRRKVIVSGLPVLEQGFIGRRDLLHEARRRVARGQRLLVFQGLGGLGKTALASYLIDRVFAVAPAKRLILQCRGLETASDPILELRGQAEGHGYLHGIPAWNRLVKRLREQLPEPTRGFVETVRTLRASIPDLLVYADNAESLQLGPGGDDAKALGSWRPGAEDWWHGMVQLAEEGEGLVLASTRYSWEGLDLRAHLNVGEMRPSESLRLIDTFPQLATLPMGIRARLAERVDGRPFTIELLARRLSRRLSRRDRPADGDVWSWVIEPILSRQETISADLLLEDLWVKLSPAAQEHARRVSVLELPAPVRAIDRMGSARPTLIQTGLLIRVLHPVATDEETRAVHRWSMHSLVQQFVTARMNESDRQEAHRWASAAYEAWIGEGDSTWGDYRATIFHLQALRAGDRAWPYLEEYVLWLRSQTRYQEAKRLLEACEPTGTQGDRLARAFVLLAQVQASLGEPRDRASLLLYQALALAQEPRTLDAVHNEMGELLSAQGRYREAEEVLRRVVEEREKHGRTESPGYLACLHNLASAVAGQRRYADAETIFRKVLHHEERLYGTERIEYWSSVRALAGILDLQGNPVEAETLLRQTLAAHEQLSMDSPGYPVVLHELGRVLTQQGLLTEAEAILRRALTVKEERLGVDHPSYGSSLLALAAVLRRRGRLQDAEALLRQCLAIEESALGPEHPGLYPALNNLGSIVVAQGRLEEAVSLVSKALELAVATHGRQGPDVGQILSGLAQLFHQMGRPEAGPIAREALELLTTSLGSDHPVTRKAVLLLAEIREIPGAEATSENTRGDG